MDYVDYVADTQGGKKSAIQYRVHPAAWNQEQAPHPPHSPQNPTDVEVVEVVEAPQAPYDTEPPQRIKRIKQNPNSADSAELAEPPTHPYTSLWQVWQLWQTTVIRTRSQMTVQKWLYPPQPLRRGCETPDVPGYRQIWNVLDPEQSALSLTDSGHGKASDSVTLTKPTRRQNRRWDGQDRRFGKSL